MGSETIKRYHAHPDSPGEPFSCHYDGEYVKYADYLRDLAEAKAEAATKPAGDTDRGGAIRRYSLISMSATEPPDYTQKIEENINGGFVTHEDHQLAMWGARDRERFANRRDAWDRFVEAALRGGIHVRFAVDAADAALTGRDKKFPEPAAGA